MAQYRIDEKGKRELVRVTQPAGTPVADQARPAPKRAAAGTAPTPAASVEAPKE